MPEISRFFGIIITMYHNDHGRPHFHAKYAEHKAKIDIATGDIIEGYLPSRALDLVCERRDLHLDGLMTNWNLAMSRQKPSKIGPLE